MSRTTKKHRRTALIVLLVLLIIIVAAGGTGLYLYNYYKNYDEAYMPEITQTVSFSIANGSSTGAIANKLEEFGLIENAGIFKIKSRILGLDSKYQAGTYDLSPAMTMSQIMEEIQHGTKETVRFTVQEGLNLVQVGEKLAKDGLIDKPETFYKALEDEYGYWFLEGLEGEYEDPTGKISAKGNRLEGFLYPNTYDVYKGASAHEIINKMLGQFAKMVPENSRDRLAALNKKLGTSYTMHDIVVAASIIEMETYNASKDGPGVASVIYNRLAKKMNLQSDVTVLYALGKTGGARVLNKDLEDSYSSPYSTYGKTFKGLPAGPICSPTAASVNVALAPVESNYLYFCVAADGSNRLLFTADYNQHLKNAEAWRKYMYGK